ncbi:hypothetical protein WOLCODRAFT_17392 [Wolfiporia cocos MD-104 SS10]|uniref:Uncharacterized protein n=1 Tax=Wolfiporia cocos (strain MD-104) TaxID=742152 RepID=A0A2H3JIA3_WOLCO|nr:hypothetical protein WOLCODRAFT_17392 [Wolfiporia cocos MD-104 SS10]
MPQNSAKGTDHVKFGQVPAKLSPTQQTQEQQAPLQWWADNNGPEGKMARNHPDAILIANLLVNERKSSIITEGDKIEQGAKLAAWSHGMVPHLIHVGINLWRHFCAEADTRIHGSANRIKAIVVQACPELQEPLDPIRSLFCKALHFPRVYFLLQLTL